MDPIEISLINCYTVKNGRGVGMKMGIRKPSIKKSIKARTTGKLKRQVKKAVNPMYGKKGMGFVNDPKKAVYNKVYNKTSVGVSDLVKTTSSTSTTARKTTTVTTSTSSTHSPTTYKVAGVIAIVAAVVIITMSLLLLLAVPTAGIIFGLCGVGLFILGKTYTKKAKAMRESNQQ